MKNDMKSFIKEKVSKRITGFINEPELVNSEYEREKELTRAYRGRELLELIQNAEDELLDDQPKEIYISFDGYTLSIGNYGEPFSKDGIISLMYSNNSGKKYRKKKVIGNKGTGFRAILGWANSISINSEDLHIRFSPQYSQKILKENVVGKVKLKRGQKTATLVFPEWVDDYPEIDMTTRIDINIKNDDSVSEDIEDQLNSLDSIQLLFLNRTEKLTVNNKGDIISFEKRIIDDSHVELLTTTADEVLIESWLLNERNGVIGDEHYSIIIAYRTDGDIYVEPYIYSYFQTDVLFPFPVLLHADFNLNPDRNHLVKNDISNRIILEDAAALLVDTAIKVNMKGVSYDRIKFLLPTGELSQDLAQYHFADTLREKMMESEIFPTVNNQYVKYSSNLKFYESGLAKYLTGKEFSDLLMYSDQSRVDNYLNELSCTKYDYIDIAYKVDRWVKSRKVTNDNIRKVAYTAIQFINEYKDEWDFRNEKNRPSFFYNSNRKLISADKSVFLMDEEINISKPPIFANVEFMDPYMRQYLYKRLKDESESDVDVIIDNLGLYNVREYNTEELVDHINGIIDEKITAGNRKNARDRWKSLIKWLWVNRGTLFDRDKKIKMFFLNREGDLEYSDIMYYGIEYGNNLCEELIGNILPDRMICDLHKYIDTEDDEELISFISLFGISEMPRIEKHNRGFYTGNANSDSYDEYLKKVFSDLPFPMVLDNKGDFKDVDEFCNRVNQVYIERSEIALLELILNNCSTTSIIQWIQSDPALQNHVYNGVENSVMTISVTWDKIQNDRKLPFIKKQYSYIYHLFNSIPWIEVNNKRYLISDCLLGLDSNIDMSEIIVTPDISSYIKDIEGPKGKIRKDFQKVLENLGVKNNFAELKVEKIFSVFNILPYIEGSEEFAKSFYNAVIDRSDHEYTDNELDCIEYHSFIENGEILTNHGYKKAKDCYYLDGKDICDKVAQSYNLICIPKKRSKKRINQLFGIKQLILKGEIVGEPDIHPENVYFCDDFAKYKALAFSFRMRSVADLKEQLRKFKRIRITICSALKVNYAVDDNSKKTEIELDDYEYILDNNSDYYLKVPENLTVKELRHNMSLATAVANIFSSYLDSDEIVKDFKFLYYAGDNSERYSIVDQELEDKALIEKSKELMDYTEDSKEEFISILVKLSGKKPSQFKSFSDKIDFDYFNADYNNGYIIDALKYAGINAGDYNQENPSTTIDLVPSFRKLVEERLPYFKDKYKITWFRRLENASLMDKLKLVSNFLLYDDLNIRVYNDIYFDVDKEIIKQLGIDAELDHIDLGSVYNANYHKWIHELEDDSFALDFLSDNENRSLIYYGEYKVLDSRYKEFCFELHDMDAIEDENDDQHHESKLDIIKRDTRPADISCNRKNDKKNVGFVKKGNSKENEHIGFLGEKIVYDYLLKHKAYKLVSWVSENAAKADVNPEGIAGLGYDIEIIDQDGHRKYIEVKSSKSKYNENIRFYLSDNEYEFGKKHSDDYIVYYVFDVKSDNPQSIVLDNVFNNNSFNSNKYAVTEHSEYMVIAQIV